MHPPAQFRSPNDGYPIYVRLALDTSIFPKAALYDPYLNHDSLLRYLPVSEHKEIIRFTHDPDRLMALGSRLLRRHIALTLQAIPSWSSAEFRRADDSGLGKPTLGLRSSPRSSPDAEPEWRQLAGYDFSISHSKRTSESNGTVVCVACLYLPTDSQMSDDLNQPQTRPNHIPRVFPQVGVDIQALPEDIELERYVGSTPQALTEFVGGYCGLVTDDSPWIALEARNEIFPEESRGPGWRPISKERAKVVTRQINVAWTVREAVGKMLGIGLTDEPEERGVTVLAKIEPADSSMQKVQIIAEAGEEVNQTSMGRKALLGMSGDLKVFVECELWRARTMALTTVVERSIWPDDFPAWPCSSPLPSWKQLTLRELLNGATIFVDPIAT